MYNILVMYVSWYIFYSLIIENEKILVGFLCDTDTIEDLYFKFKTVVNTFLIIVYIFIILCFFDEVPIISFIIR